MKSNLFWKSSFFRETPLWGLCFICHAKSILEVILWYGVFLLLSGLALKDIAKIIDQYRMGFSKTTVTIGLNSSNATLPEMSIVIKLPSHHVMQMQIELLATVNRVPYTEFLTYNDSGMAWVTETRYVPCINSFTLQDKTLSSDNVEEIRNNTITSYSEWLNEASDLRSSMMDGWLAMDYLSNTLTENMGLEEREQFIRESMVRLNQMIRQLSEYKTYRQINLTHLLNHEPKSAEELKSVKNAMSTRLLLETYTGKIHLRDWHSDTFQHTLTYGIVDGVQDASQITVDIYSLSLSRMLLVYEAMANYIHHREQVDFSELLNDERNFLFGYGDCSEEMSGQLGIRFGDIQKEYSTAIDAKLESSVGHVQLHPFQKTQILLKTTGQMFSRTANCYSGSSRRQCEDQCIMDETLTACSCIPYWLDYLSEDDITLCDNVPQKQCTSKAEEDCKVQCDRKLANACKQSLLTVESSSQLLDIMYVGTDPHTKRRMPVVNMHEPMISFTITKTEACLVNNGFRVKMLFQLINHPVYLKDYAMSSSDLIVWMAGVAEFWIGLNVVALVHMVIYALRCYQQKAHPDLKTDLEMVQLQLKDLKESSQFRQCNRLWFLSGNSYFKTTPLSAFGFINQSVRRWECTAWYCVVLVFIGITAYNVNNALNRYGLKETESSPKMLFGMDQAGMPNFTLTIQTSYLDYFEFMHTLTDLESGFSISFINFEDDLEGAFGDVLRACSGTNSIEPKLYNIGDPRATFPLAGTSNVENGTQDLHQVYDHLAQSQTWSDWLRNVGMLLWEDSVEYWKNPDHGLANAMDPYSEGHTYRQLFSAFIALQSMKLGKESLEYAKELNLEREPAQVDMKSHTGLLFDMVNLYLRRMVGLSVGEVFFEHWSLNAVAGTHRFSVQAVIPPNSKELTIKIYSITFAQILMAFKSMVDHLCELFDQNCNSTYFNIDSCDQILQCHGNGGLGKALVFRQMYDILISNLFKHVKAAYNIQVHVAGAEVHLKPLEQHLVELLATGRYVSETDECYAGTLDSCVSSCQAQQALQMCSCLPWHFMYTQQSTQMCHEPCLLNDTTHCTQLCGSKVQKPCDSSILRPVHTESKNIKHIDWYSDKPIVNFALPLASFTIRMKEKWMHPMFIERYKMTVGQLMAELGASMDMWLGINIFAFIHLGKYLLFQVALNK